jgi:hypothetical protein
MEGQNPETGSESDPLVPHLIPFLIALLIAYT